jgi:tRNA G46 methylase TrmB
MQEMGSSSLFYSKVIVELGMGDGRLLEALATHNSNSLCIGIEIDNTQCRLAKSRMSRLPNVVIMNCSFVDVVPTFMDESISQFIMVLPDPAYIDEKREDRWKPFYKTIYSKLKKGGTLRLVTELTDEILQPVGDDQYLRWTCWLKSSFRSLGFALTSHNEGSPREYFSSCLEQFRGDPQRIRMITLNLQKLK